jgi:hypothetical protein
MKIRLHGTPAECEAATTATRAAIDVLAVSNPYPDCGTSRLVRVYLDVRLPTDPPDPTSPSA